MILIVSGMPRSGTSLMMRCLEGGGIPVLKNTERDNKYPEDNPNGYYEINNMHRVGAEPRLLHAADGKAVKVLMPWLLQLSIEDHGSMRVIFMRRNFKELVRSQLIAMEARNQQPRPLPAALEQANRKFIEEANNWLFVRRQDIPSCEIWYNELVSQPQATLGKVITFLDNVGFEHNAKLFKMVRLVDPKLYRQREP